jgi:hypothetical protein
MLSDNIAERHFGECHVIMQCIIIDSHMLSDIVVESQKSRVSRCSSGLLVKNYKFLNLKIY